MLTKTNLQFFFPTVIGHSYEHDLRDKIFPVVQQTLADKNLLTNEWGYKNTYTDDIGLETRPEYQEVADFIKQKGQDYLTMLGWKAKKDLSVNIFVSGMEKGDRHDRHCHPGALLSGVFYLECPKGSSDIIFFDPRSHHDHRSGLTRIDTNDITSDMSKFPPTNGLFLIWESWIHHQVTVNESETTRTTLVFNMG